MGQPFSAWGTGLQVWETGVGRMLEPDQLLEDIVAFFAPIVLAGQQGADHSRADP
jgi:hypothetical protein